MYKSLKDITSKIGSGATPAGGQEAYKNSGISLIRSQNVLDFKFSRNGLAYIDDVQAKGLANVEVRKDDILLNITGDSIARACLVPPEILPARVNQHVSIIRCNPDVSPHFVLYYLQYLKPYLLKICGVGGTRNALTKDVIEKLEIAINPQQQVIGAILSNLDAKISLNNRINTELEVMAKTIYDYWFVQFDFPISKEQAKTMGKSKLEGKPYKASGGKMVWSKELKREVPDGWLVSTVGRLFETSLGGTPSTKNEEFWKNGKHHWLNSGEVAEFPVTTSELKITEQGIKRSATELLPKGTTLLSITRHLRPTILAIDACVNQSVVGIKELKDLRCCFIYPYLKNEIPRLMSMRTGAQQPHINKEIVDASPIVIPDKNSDLLKRYNELVESIYMKIFNNALENQRLAELRDWLLPMLMNGQVKIKEATQSKVAKPVLPQSKPANPYFYQTQLVSTIVNASKNNKISHGEMTLAKYTYLVDKLYGVPTYFNYDRWHLGPYPKEMKKVVNNKKFFKIQNNEVSVVPQKKEYKYEFKQRVEDAIADLASIFNQYKSKERSHQTELLATVCKVVEDIQSTDLKKVRESMKKWPIELKGEKFKNKAEKFGEEETELCLKILARKKWAALLLS